MRRPKYRKDDAYLFSLNDRIKDLQASSRDGKFIFVYGVPRSGTTVLAQTLINELDLGYISNIAARFWKSPNIGIRISQDLTDYETDFKSHYGQTNLVGDLHEFGYFWKYHLPDMHSLKRGLQSISGAWKRPVLMKGLYASLHIEEINNMCDCTWVYIKRNRKDTIRSLRKARIDYYGSLREPFSVTAPDDLYVSAEAQYDNLIEYYGRTMPDNVVKVSYESFILDETGVIDEVRSRL